MGSALLGALLIATAYCDTGRTASGAYVHWGTVAAAPGIPFGTTFGLAEFPGTTFRVEDRGGLIGPGRLDIWMASCAAARQWGRRAVRVLPAPVPPPPARVEVERVTYWDTDAWVTRIRWQTSAGDRLDTFEVLPAEAWPA